MAPKKSSSNDGPSSLGEAATRYLSQLAPEERESRQQEVYRFVKWFAFQKSLDEIPVQEIAHYAQKEAIAGGDYQFRLKPVRDFLTYARKEKLCSSGLAVHLKTSMENSRSRKSTVKRGGQQQLVHMTAEDFDALQQQLARLKEERPRVAEELRRAAADKDFRENAPLDAARERQGHIEAKIRELEATLAGAMIIGGSRTELCKADIGDTVTVHDLASQEHISYTLVGLTQVDPVRGKISHLSPIGKALVGHIEGETVEVVAPIGVQRYRIEKIQR
ncbi:MAG: greA [Dehalococcoidia bacterium]|nr:greA [Dehalococcoidia bacterium]